MRLIASLSWLKHLLGTREKAIDINTSSITTTMIRTIRIATVLHQHTIPTTTITVSLRLLFITTIIMLIPSLCLTTRNAHTANHNINNITSTQRSMMDHKIHRRLSRDSINSNDTHSTSSKDLVIMPPCPLLHQ